MISPTFKKVLLALLACPYNCCCSCQSTAENLHRGIVVNPKRNKVQSKSQGLSHNVYTALLQLCWVLPLWM